MAATIASNIGSPPHARVFAQAAHRAGGGTCGEVYPIPHPQGKDRRGWVVRFDLSLLTPAL